MQAKHYAAIPSEATVSPNEFPRTVNPMVALRALYELLESYSPMWYTQREHDLARAALGEQTVH